MPQQQVSESCVSEHSGGRCSLSVRVQDLTTPVADVFACVGTLQERQVVGKCMNAKYIHRPHLKNILGVESIYTLHVLGYPKMADSRLADSRHLRCGAAQLHAATHNTRYTTGLLHE